jgi:hypothetical protein
VNPEQQETQRSSVKLIRNAKGDAQWEIKVLAGDDQDVLNAAREVAVAQHNTLLQELGVIA